MSDPIPTELPTGESAQPVGLAGTAARGTGWTSGQALINKVATMGAMWVVALRLSPDEFGMAALTLAVGAFLMILPPLTIGDVVVTHRRRFALVAPAANRMAMWIAVATTILIALAAPIVGWVYEQYPTGILVGLVWVLSLRPIADGLAAVPLAGLRIDFRYRAIAMVDGSIQLIATLTTVAMALLEMGALSLVLPQVATMFVKAICYRVQRSHPGQSGREMPVVGMKLKQVRAHSHRRTIRRRIFKEFAYAAGAQYVHNVLVLLPVLVLGYCSTEEQAGFYAFAFTLGAQANGLIAAQLGTVYQPIFVKLGESAQRQADGFLRVVRVIGAVAVPVCLLQGALAEPLFHLVFQPKWEGAIVTFVVLSALEGFYFATAPTMAMLRAQGRFGTYFLWQSTQFGLSLIAYSIGASYHGALGVALAALVLWGTSLPVAVWLCTQGVNGKLRAAIGVMLAPWMTAAPIACAAWGAWKLLSGMGTAGMVVSLLVVGPSALAISIWAIRFSQPAAWADLSPMASKLRGKAIRTLGLHRSHRTPD